MKYQSEPIEFSVEIKGKTHTGFYREEDGMVIVTTLENGRKEAYLGNITARVMARILLRELIPESGE